MSSTRRCSDLWRMNSVAAGDIFEEVSLISVITEISDESDFESRGLNGLSCRVSAGSGHKRSSPAGGGGPPVGWWRGTGGLRGGGPDRAAFPATEPCGALSHRTGKPTVPLERKRKLCTPV